VSDEASGQHRAGDRPGHHVQGLWWALTKAPRRRLVDPSTNVFRVGFLVIGALMFFFIEGLAEVFGEHPWYIHFRGLALVVAGATVLALSVMYLLRPSTIPPDPPLFGPLAGAPPSPARRRRRRRTMTTPDQPSKGPIVSCERRWIGQTTSSQRRRGGGTGYGAVRSL
jgi:phage shock protein PspC (stress-responsive transcriptional regulator)